MFEKYVVFITTVLLNVIPVSASCQRSHNYYYCYYYSNVSIGTIVGAVIGSLFGFVVLAAIIFLVCSQIKTRGLRGTVVQPVNTISTIQSSSSQYNAVPHMSYNQYTGNSMYNTPYGNSMYPPPQNMSYPPPSQNYGPPPVYTSK